MSEQAHFTTRLATKRMSADCLFYDDEGRILVLEPAYKPTWDMPGGGVEADESPREAARREVIEEIGLDIEPGELLAIDWIPRSGDFTEALALLFDGGVLSTLEISRIVLDPSEAQSCQFVSLPEAELLLDSGQFARLVAANSAKEAGSTAYLENGHPV
jgi:8-oxo-dGTP diphosphatase